MVKLKNRLIFSVLVGSCMYLHISVYVQRPTCVTYVEVNLSDCELDANIQSHYINVVKA